MTEKKLTDKEQMFCIEYCTNGFNATQAAIVAGYSQRTAKEIGSQNLSKLHIKEEIKRLRGDFEDLMAQKGITRERNITEAAKIAYANMSEIHDTWIGRKDFENIPQEVKSCIQEIDTKIQTKNLGTKQDPEMVDVEYVKVKFFDKLKAIEILNKMMGWNEPEELAVKNLTTLVIQRAGNEKDPDDK